MKPSKPSQYHGGLRIWDVVRILLGLSAFVFLTVLGAVWALMEPIK